MSEATIEQPADAPPRATLGQRATAATAWVLSRAFCWSPSWLAYGVADLLAPLLYRYTARRERRIEPRGRGLIRNQRIALREAWTPERSRTHMRAWASHMTRLVVDFCRVPRITSRNVAQMIDMTEFETIRELYAEGKGAVCVSGHIGCWELCGHLAAVSDYPVLTVARSVKNPALQRVLQGIRECGGQRTASKWGVLWPLHRALSRGCLIGIAADENAPLNPVFVPFLGTMAATNTSAAVLAQRSGAPIVVLTCNRVGRGRFRFHIWDVIRVEKSTARESDREAITARINRALSAAIVAYPDQWLWGLRRFTTRPEHEVPGPDGLPPPAAGWRESAEAIARRFD